MKLSRPLQGFWTLVLLSLIFVVLALPPAAVAKGPSSGVHPPGLGTGPIVTQAPADTTGPPPDPGTGTDHGGSGGGKGGEGDPDDCDFWVPYFLNLLFGGRVLTR